MKKILAGTTRNGDDSETGNPFHAFPFEGLMYISTVPFLENYLKKNFRQKNLKNLNVVTLL
jgi:hypothetical protein